MRAGRRDDRVGARGDVVAARGRDVGERGDQRLALRARALRRVPDHVRGERRAARAVDAEHDRGDRRGRSRRPRAPSTRSPTRARARRSAQPGPRRSSPCRCRRPARSVAIGAKPTLAGSTRCVDLVLHHRAAARARDHLVEAQRAVDQAELLELARLGRRGVDRGAHRLRRERARRARCRRRTARRANRAAPSAISRFASLIWRPANVSAALLYAPTRSTSSSMPSFSNRPPKNRNSPASPTSGARVASRDEQLLRRARDVVFEVAAERRRSRDRRSCAGRARRAAAIASRISCAFAQPISSERTRSTTAARRSSRSAIASSESSDASGRGGCRGQAREQRRLGALDVRALEVDHEHAALLDRRAPGAEPPADRDQHEQDQQDAADSSALSMTSLACGSLAIARAAKRRLSFAAMAKEVYVAAVGLTKVDLTGRIFGSIFDLFADAYLQARSRTPRCAASTRCRSA